MTTSNHHSSTSQQRSQHKQLTLCQGRYICQKTLGCGTYGRVLQCFDQKTNSTVAVKVSQKESAYTRAALVEYNTILSLQERSVHTVRVYEQFEERGHICIAMELLSQNLFELGRKRVESKGELLHVDELRQIIFCVLNALTELHRLGLMHCDIKPENIMVRNNKSTTSPVNNNIGSSPSSSAFVHLINNPQSTPVTDDGRTHASPNSGTDTSSSQGSGGDDSPVRSHQVDWSNTCLIDYGAVRRLHENSYFDIQSMWYRAPEVLCHVMYTPQIDSWSMGCLLYEMYTGRPLFMGNDPIEQLQLIAEMVGSFPHLRERYPKLAMGKVEHTHENMVEILRKKVEAARAKQLQRSDRLHHQTAQNSAKSVVSSRGSMSSDGLSASCQCHSSLPEVGISSPTNMHSSAYVTEGNTSVSNTKFTEALFIDLMARLLSPDEFRRISCEDALSHPFFTSAIITPPPENSAGIVDGTHCGGTYLTGHQKILGSPSFSSASGLSASPSLPSGFTNVSATNSSGNLPLPQPQHNTQVHSSTGVNPHSLSVNSTFSTSGWHGNNQDVTPHLLPTARAPHHSMTVPLLPHNNNAINLNSQVNSDAYYVTSGTRPILVPFSNPHQHHHLESSIGTGANVEYFPVPPHSNNITLNGNGCLPQQHQVHPPSNNVIFRSASCNMLSNSAGVNSNPFMGQKN